MSQWLFYFIIIVNISTLVIQILTFRIWFRMSGLHAAMLRGHARELQVLHATMLKLMTERT